MKANDIRDKFIKFFINYNHEHIPDSSLVPEHDPTLMFTNSGMVQFKNIFTGRQNSTIQRAVSHQRCLRVGGKHNDLENVGYTSRHHTFFEMLGNFSFGNYFKETAIELAWTFLTKELAIDKNSLSITVYHTDDETYNIWHKVSGLSHNKIIRIVTDDNFWSMGKTGPCGPSSEIFYHYPQHDIQGNHNIVEIWNLVFMEFYKDLKGTLYPLPKKCIDTGMGLERISAVMQNVYDNYHTDIFSDLIYKSQEYCGNLHNTIAHKIIADHVRASAFLIMDGITPGNEGRKYVLRRLIRRAARYIHQLGYNDPLLYRIFPSLIDQHSSSYMGNVYPNLIRAKSIIETTLKLEEEHFKETLMQGINLLDSYTKNLNTYDTLQGELAFKLYDTYGFPLDITLDILKEKKIHFDQKGFDYAMTKQKERARNSWLGSGECIIDQLWLNLIETLQSTQFVGYQLYAIQDAQVLAIISSHNKIVLSAQEGERITIILNKTPFYCASGGQIGDSGWMMMSSRLPYMDTEISQERMKKNIIFVEDTNSIGSLYLHKCIVKLGSIHQYDIVQAEIDLERRNNLSRNHSATHLLHFALRKTLGCHVTQKGSLIIPEKLRFDFLCHDQMTQKQLFVIEDMVNALISTNLAVSTKVQHIQQALNEDVIALFGEKYSDNVRVVHIGDSRELCAGTHVKYTGEIGLFKIIKESSVGFGVRRIEAITGQASMTYIRNNENQLKKVAEALRVPVSEIISRISVLHREIKTSISQRDLLYKKLITLENISNIQINGIYLMRHDFIDIPCSIIREFTIQQYKHNTVMIFTAQENHKTNLFVKISQDLTTYANAQKIMSVATGKKCNGNAAFAQTSCHSDVTSSIVTAIYNSICTLHLITPAE
ncbi:alanine--tRNA ligase [Wolbachia endosymbiont of Howardula sp.]|uniref:alanine--tRNA ligase n=1 Tax=Wolbachia endosymbiont of Howardula sp. TaxID=2916816 RepID=UPI00217E489D|nr:alanine--tRNA ligase [Wolbachia endosymbiont of Howardula sp.]UWI83014.1 alanine--tRNA ligase [Wolbachia endosymbiont of Howardula sp.]